MYSHFDGILSSLFASLYGFAVVQIQLLSVQFSGV